MDILVHSRGHKKVALRLLHKLLKKQGCTPDSFVTDKLPSYGTALKDLGLSKRHEGANQPAALDPTPFVDAGENSAAIQDVTK
jgi:transposase-like protein